MDEIRYQVFVSSTFTDLKEEREKVLQAILQLRAFPAGMELFPAADDEQFEFIKREIDSSDYYLVIIGGKYGSTDEFGLSFTEKEYDYARSAGKPVLAFIVRDTGKLIGEKLERTEELRSKLEAFTGKAKKSKLVNFFANPDELKSAVLVSLPSQFSLKPMRGWVRAGQTSRDDLERISSLQTEVLSLSEENRRLSAENNAVEAVLAHGTDEVSWNLDLNDYSADNKWPAIREISITTTWDDLLSAIFASGSSQQTSNEVRRTLARFIIQRSPVALGSDEWRSAMESVFKTYTQIPPFTGVQQMFGDALRQFNGLGLISESKETIYTKDTFSNARLADTTDVWRLLPKGQQQLAIIRGFKRNNSR